ncbi:hypothetical protein OEZ86_000775 [Tetradesmus obliquus]|nr:hypothetical protein OEZ86_000775 [Tetradesmus obliquus]
MSDSQAAALQLQQFLQQVAGKATSSHSDGSVKSNRQHSKRQADLQAQQAAANSIDVLLQVPWFADLAVAGCRHASITPLGQLTLTSSGSSSSSSSSSSSTAEPPPQQQQQQQGGGTQQPGSAAAAALHELLLLGLSSKDSQCRARALHLLQASVQQGWGPQVPGFAEPQWQAFLAVFRAQEERVLHLIQPCVGQALRPGVIL